MIFGRKVDGDDGVGAHAVALGVGLEGRQIDDGELGDEIGELGALGADQQLTDEQRMPGELGEDAGLDPVFRIGAAIEVLGEQRLAARVRDEILVQQIEIRLRELAVAVPPHGVLGERVDDGVLVLGRAAGVDAGLRAERAAGHDGGLASRDRVLVERGRGVIPVDRGEILEAEFVGAVGAVPQTRFLHERPPHDVRPPPELLPDRRVFGRGSADHSARPANARPIVGIGRPAKTLCGRNVYARDAHFGSVKSGEFARPQNRRCCG